MDNAEIAFKFFDLYNLSPNMLLISVVLIAIAASAILAAAHFNSHRGSKKTSEPKKINKSWRTQ